MEKGSLVTREIYRYRTLPADECRSGSTTKSVSAMFKNVLRIFSERANALVIILTALQFSHQSLVPLDIVSLYFTVDFHMNVPPQTD
jgi:hypothetical protein